MAGIFEGKRLRGGFRRLLAAFPALFMLGLTGCWTTVSSEPQVDPVSLAAAVRDVGLDQLRQGNYSMAIRKLQQAELKNPSDPLVYYGLGEAYRRKGLLNEAELNLLKSLEVSPDSQAPSHQLAVLTLATLYLQGERYDETEALCDILIVDPTYDRPWEALNVRGWAQYKSGQFEKARASYLEALSFRSDYAVAHFNLGILDHGQQRWPDALRELQVAAKSKDLAPSARSEAHFLMAEIYMIQGRRSDAIRSFGLSIEIAPDGEWAEKSRSKLEILL
ncbi:MAG: tetratricopeptide repeat protein [Myxococcota bacterium]|jgi:Flp pilus assembly protein TadD|nr:tetratricopeptide repeat protein [Myxococcota bacterium]